MFLLVCRCEPLDLGGVLHTFFFLFAQGKQDIFNFLLVEVDMWIQGNVFDDAALEFEGIDGLALGFGDERHDAWLVGAPHSLYFNFAKKRFNFDTGSRFHQSFNMSKYFWPNS